MLMFILRRLGTIILTMFCLTLIVFYLVNLEPNLEKIAKTQASQRMTDTEVDQWLDKNGYGGSYFYRYGQWLGVVPGWTRVDEDTGNVTGRCIARGEGRVPDSISTDVELKAWQENFEGQFCGVFQGQFGNSLRLQKPVGELIAEYLGYTGILMFWVMVTMVPMALIIGVLAGMREGSALDRSLSVGSITSTSAPEYVTGLIFAVIFATTFGILNGVAPTSRLEYPEKAISAYQEGVFTNWIYHELGRIGTLEYIWERFLIWLGGWRDYFGHYLAFYTLPVMTMAIYGMGYIARMTRASMAEVMTSQYIRTARLKGLAFRKVVMKHALRNALIAPFTVIMLQFPWLLTGVVIVESMFAYKGFGWMLVTAADNNDVELLMGCSMVAVIVVLLTQLISDIGYAYLNPRIRVR